MVQSGVATETYQSTSGGTKPEIAYPAKSTDPATRKRPRKRKRILPQINGRSSIEGLSTPETQVKLTEKVLEDSQFGISVEMGSLDCTSDNRKSGATTPRSVIHFRSQESRQSKQPIVLTYANHRTFSSESDINYESNDSFGNDVQSRTPKKIPEQQLSTFVPSGNNSLSSSKEEWSVRLTDGDVLNPSLRIIGTVLTTPDRPWYL